MNSDRDTEELTDRYYLPDGGFITVSDFNLDKPTVMLTTPKRGTIRLLVKKKSVYRGSGWVLKFKKNSAYAFLHENLSIGKTYLIKPGCEDESPTRTPHMWGEREGKLSSNAIVVESHVRRLYQTKKQEENKAREGKTEAKPLTSNASTEQTSILFSENNTPFVAEFFGLEPKNILGIRVYSAGCITIEFATSKQVTEALKKFKKSSSITPVMGSNGMSKTKLNIQDAAEVEKLKQFVQEKLNQAPSPEKELDGEKEEKEEKERKNKEAEEVAKERSESYKKTVRLLQDSISLGNLLRKYDNEEKAHEEADEEEADEENSAKHFPDENYFFKLADGEAFLTVTNFNPDHPEQARITLFKRHPHELEQELTIKNAKENKYYMFYHYEINFKKSVQEWERLVLKDDFTGAKQPAILIERMDNPESDDLPKQINFIPCSPEEVERFKEENRKEKEMSPIRKDLVELVLHIDPSEIRSMTREDTHIRVKFKDEAAAARHCGTLNNCLNLRMGCYVDRSMFSGRDNSDTVIICNQNDKNPLEIYIEQKKRELAQVEEIGAGPSEVPPVQEKETVAGPSEPPPVREKEIGAVRPAIPAKVEEIGAGPSAAISPSPASEERKAFRKAVNRRIGKLDTDLQSCWAFLFNPSLKKAKISALKTLKKSVKKSEEELSTIIENARNENSCLDAGWISHETRDLLDRYSGPKRK